MESFTSGRDFKDCARGPFDYRLTESDGHRYWLTEADTNGLKIVNTAPRVSGQNYLDLKADEPLERCIKPVEESVLTNLVAYGNLYLDTHVQFTTSYSSPVVASNDTLAVWLHEVEGTDGACTTNLIVTAGYYTNSFNAVALHDYVATNIVTSGAWHRLTVRAIANITTQGGRGFSYDVPGFVLYLDGQPLAFDVDVDDIGTDYRSDWLTSEARVLISEGRLFPWLVNRTSDGAKAFARAAYTGKGAVDDVWFSSIAPDCVQSNTIFTLQWAKGVTSFTCIMSNASDVVTNALSGLTAAGMRDFKLGTNTYARVTVTNITYDATLGYTNGIWTAANDCTTQDVAIASGVFVYKGAKANPMGHVGVSRDIISIGGKGGYETFAEAKERAKEKGERIISLATNVIIRAGLLSGYKDSGVFLVGKNDDVVLDLNGHTLQGLGREDYSTIYQTGGTLTIIDTVGGGAVLPPTNGTVAVCSYQEDNTTHPKLVIEAGRFAGEVRISGKTNTAFCAECAIGGGSFTNIFDESTFYLEEYVTNSSAYFGLDSSNYWSVVSDDAFIWCGKGADAYWTTGENWRGGVAPKAAEDLAIFPRRGDTQAWSVDFGSGVATKRLWLDADVAMSGTNEFSDVTIVSGRGAFRGTGMMTYTGKLPGLLTAQNACKVNLATNWQGTVKISGIVNPAKLTNIDGWGVAGSKVEFAGVRGYIMDQNDHALPYELILTDDGTTPAWKNDTGYTGSTISFPRLSGEGTFTVPKNSRTVSQIYKFVDVRDFLGSFSVVGRRIVLGTEDACDTAGAITFSGGITVHSGLNWSGVGAYFGSTLNVYGKVNDTLMSYTGTTAPSVAGVTVLLYDAAGGFTTNKLVAADGKVTIAFLSELLLDGSSVSSSEFASQVKAGSKLTIQAGSAIEVDANNNVLVNGQIFATLADYYTLTQSDTSLPVFTVTFDKAKVTPSVANFSVSSVGGTATLTVTNAKKGLWYGLRSTSSLAESLDKAAVDWQQAMDDTVTFKSKTSDSSCFYQVIMTDQSPAGGAQ